LEYRLSYCKGTSTGRQEATLGASYQNGNTLYAYLSLSFPFFPLLSSPSSVSTWCTCIQEFDTMDTTETEEGTDLVRLWQKTDRATTRKVASTGRGLRRSLPLLSPPFSSPPFFLTRNGRQRDGKSDLVRTGQTERDARDAAVFSLFPSLPPSPDTLSSIVDGWGPTPEWTTWNLTNARYTPKELERPIGRRFAGAALVSSFFSHPPFHFFTRTSNYNMECSSGFRGGAFWFS